MALGGLALLSGLWAGLLRLGWDLPLVSPGLPGAHGALMVGGFLGTVIGLERAVALRQGWAYVAPLLSGLGGVALLGARGLPWPLWALGPALLTLGSLALVVVYIAVLRTQLTLFTGVMALGAAVLTAGDLLWLGWLPIYQTALWWAGFLVLTIVGERLELSRMAPRARASRPLFLLAAGVYLLGISLSVSLQDVGTRVMGAGLVGLALWLAKYDIARRTVRQRGLTRFIAAGLLAGYAWLLVSGALALRYGAVAAGARYDALLHAMFLGFVMSMIFAHAPIILPAVTGLAVPYRRVFYAHLVLLHASLIVRVGADLLGWRDGREWGGLFNVLAVLLFLGSTALAARAGRRAAVRARAARNLVAQHSE